MALFACGECGHQISTKAASCPNCGAKVEKSPAKAGRWRLWMFLLLAIPLVYVEREKAWREKARQEEAARQEAAKTPEQREQERLAKEKQRQQEKKAEEKRNRAIASASAGAAVLKRAMKDPQAFELTSVRVTDNGTACYDYRAKNSFGAILPDSAVLSTSGKLLVRERDGSSFVSVWNSDCTKPAEEVVDLVKRLLIRAE